MQAAAEPQHGLIVGLGVQHHRQRSICAPDDIESRPYQIEGNALVLPMRADRNRKFHGRRAIQHGGQKLGHGDQPPPGAPPQHHRSLQVDPAAALQQCVIPQPAMKP
ncbi:MAG: hypothetical protein HZT43_18875 [Exiguobacterium profundum]|nr:MAG: hypothetical protein HZT43_18875 [Exiguobacterium profundum]